MFFLQNAKTQVIQITGKRGGRTGTGGRERHENEKGETNTGPNTRERSDVSTGPGTRASSRNERSSQPQSPAVEMRRSRRNGAPINGLFLHIFII